MLVCQVFQNCNKQIPGLIHPVLFANASSKCSQEFKIKTECMDKDVGAVLSYSCSDQVNQTNEGCKDILRISACQGEIQTCNHCKYSSVGVDINTLCVNKTGPLIVFFDRRCENLPNQLTIWHEIHVFLDEQLESSAHLSTHFFTTSSSSPSTSEQYTSFSTTDNILTKSDMNNQEKRTFEIIGLAVGISASVAVIIIIACVLIFLRKKKRSSKKQCTQISSNGQDYIGNQNIAMPWPGDSEYNDLKVRRESHKYGELKFVSEATGDSCYDVIDANEHTRETKVFSDEHGTFQNDSSSRSCQEYAMLDPSEKWKTESNKSSDRDTACDDYTVLEAEEARINHPAYPPSDQFDKSLNTYQTKNNEKKLEVTSSHNATREDYTVLDPELTGFNRMNHTGNNKLLEKRAIFDPTIREMDHNTTHPLKEDTKYYELAKPIDEDGKEITCHKYDGDYGFSQDSDYNQLKAEHPKYSEEHVYNHTVDDVYDTTSHNKKCTTPDNTYDYFSGDKTDDDYNIPMKM
ncbi:unnamed protein product [Mytilus coruscus]|uniref:Uncharacterized protein n=1 Tax=Mytilus coruscus TaxID=42192 RepID=A0A6J8B2A5_MYTCO|nr:unnamed protein product [Mytilus coruscus]